MRNLCPDDETLMDFVEGRLSPRQREKIEIHLSACDLCREQTAVCARVIYAERADQRTEVPEGLTQRAVERVARLNADGHRQRTAGGIPPWVVKGMAALERLVLRGEPAPVALRGEAVVSEHLIRRTKRFEDLAVVIEIEKCGSAQALIRVALAKEEAPTGAPVRVALFKGDREAASMLLAGKPVVFEDMTFGVYTLVFSRSAPIGAYTFEIAEQPGEM